MGWVSGAVPSKYNERVKYFAYSIIETYLSEGVKRNSEWSVPLWV